MPAMLSNAFQHVDPKLKFDLIASNVPAKVGKELWPSFCTMPMPAAAGRRLWVVSITGLRFTVRARDEGRVRQLKVKQGRQYTVAMAVRG